MAVRVIFTAPDGEQSINPDFKWLSNLIVKAGDEYWASGSGDAGLRFERDGSVYAEMILVIRADYGAMLHHVYSSDGLEYVMSDPSLGQAEITVKQAGQPWSLPRAFFVDRDKAATAVRRFLQDGERATAESWVEF